jgi:hypothetical protein
LISWSWLCKANKHGGLAVKDISKQNVALLARWTTYLFTKQTNKWTQLYDANLELLNWTNKRSNRRLGYSTIDKVLFDKPKSFKKLHYRKLFGMHGLIYARSYTTGSKVHRSLTIGTDLNFCRYCSQSGN